MKAFPSDSALFGAIARDWNGDGKPDLAVLTRTVHLLTNQSVALSKDLNQSVIPDECEASARLESLTFEPTRVSGGSSATATLTLASAAPAEGANVRLAGSAPELTRFPESIVVSGGETKVTFKIKTTPVEKAVAAVLTARKDHVERRAALTVLPPKFRRGDVDQDGSLNLTDAIDIFLYLFLGGDMPFCLDAADADDN